MGVGVGRAQTYPVPKEVVHVSRRINAGIWVAFFQESTNNRAGRPRPTATSPYGPLL